MSFMRMHGRSVEIVYSFRFVFFFISSAFSPLPILQMVNVYQVINTNVHSWLACIVRPVILGHAWVQIAKFMYVPKRQHIGFV